MREGKDEKKWRQGIEISFLMPNCEKKCVTLQRERTSIPLTQIRQKGLMHKV